MDAPAALKVRMAALLHELPHFVLRLAHQQVRPRLDDLRTLIRDATSDIAEQLVRVEACLVLVELHEPVLRHVALLKPTDDGVVAKSLVLHCQLRHVGRKLSERAPEHVERRYGRLV
eukprot:4529319-Prymnesium_polylepis.1